VDHIIIAVQTSNTVKTLLQAKFSGATSDQSYVLHFVLERNLSPAKWHENWNISTQIMSKKVEFGYDCNNILLTSTDLSVLPQAGIQIVWKT